MKTIAILTTVGSEEEGESLARALLERQEVACVNIIPGVKSLYRWKGEVCCDREQLLIIKTLEGQVDRVAATLQELHSYELPEFLVLDVAQGDPRYLEWIANNVAAPTSS